LGSCPTDATREAAPGVPFANLPLCQRPNVCDSNRGGILARWFHIFLRAWVTNRIFGLRRIVVKDVRTTRLVPIFTLKARHRAAKNSIKHLHALPRRLFEYVYGMAERSVVLLPLRPRLR
jgi:hypothetical protein